MYVFQYIVNFKLSTNLDIEFQISILTFGFLVLNVEFQIFELEFRILNFGFRVFIANFCIFETYNEKYIFIPVYCEFQVMKNLG